jgi:glutaredoxin
MTMGDHEAILYGSDECSESKAMAQQLSDMGVEFRIRLVNRDAAAQSEWEQLDGEKVPMLRMGHDTIVRGFDRIRIQQIFGWVGC